MFEHSTRIERLKLRNFIGIYTGMGLEEIEIDFSKSNKRNILILGSNGSGKSTILSSLHPFSGTFDDRSNIILDGKIGRKEIDITQNGVLYKIVHHYESGKNKSTISKTTSDGKTTQLNPNGSVRLFGSIVEEELGITENYFKLIKVGSQSLNFIDLKTTQRKEFIGDFTPDIEQYLEAYKGVNAKFNSTTKEIKFITNELDKLDDSESVNTLIRTLDKTIRDIEECKTKLNVEIAIIKEKEEDYTEIEKLLTEKKELYKNLEFKEVHTVQLQHKFILANGKFNEDRESLLSSIDAMNASIKELETLKARLEGESSILSTKPSTIKASIERIRNEISKYVNPNEDSIENVKEMLDNLNEEFTLIASEVSYGINVENFEEFLSDTYVIEEVIEDHSTKRSLMFNLDSRLELIYSRSNDTYFDDIAKDIKGNIGNLQSVCNKYIRELNSEINKYKQELNELASKMDGLDRENKIASLDIKHECSLGSKCCLQKLLTEAKNNSKNYKEDKAKLVEEKQSLLLSIKELESDITSIEDLLSDSERIHSIVSSISNENRKYLEELLVESGIEVPSLEYVFLFKDLRNLNNLIIADLKKRKKELNKINELSNIHKRIIRLKEYLQNYMSNHAIIESLRNELDMNVKELKASKEEYVIACNKAKEVDIELSEKQSDLKILMNNLNCLDKLTDIRAKLQLVKEEIKSIESENSEMLELLSTLESKKHDLNDCEYDLVLYNDKLSKAKLKEVRIKEYNERKLKLEESRKVLQVVKESLDVKSGIPLILVGEYLNNIRNKCNKLLDIAYKGKFYIDFEINDKEFAINVYKNGLKTAHDISQCSQGEISLVKTSLSLGILAEAMSKLEKQYTIVYLDEIDSELDQTNRMLFLDILEEQLNILNSNQCFIITHNDCFYNTEAGLILLNGANVDIKNDNFMVNKQVIYQS